MLNRLLESKVKRERSFTGAVASVAAHTALIGVAVYATAQARVDALSVQVIRPVYFVPARPAAVSEPAPGIVSKLVRSRLVFVDPAVSVTLPAIDVLLPIVGPADFHRDPIRGSGSFGAGDLAREGTDSTFRADQVERQVSLIPGSAPPRYPEGLRAAGVEGQVVARFVVGEEGRVEEGTVKVVRSDNHLFDEAVRLALPRMRFTPAAIGGKTVRQQVEMPFVFTLSR
jgi:protein TonB